MGHVYVYTNLAYLMIWSPLWVKTRKRICEDYHFLDLEDLKNLRIEDHTTDDRGFRPKPKCKDQAAENEEFGK